MKKRNSFTLVEILVALAILMLLVGSMAGIEISNIKLADSGKRQLQATGLARGALNLVRTIRDTNVLQRKIGNAVFDGLTADGVTKYLNEKADHTWELTTNPAATTYYPLNNTNPLDGTTYTVEVTVSE